VAERFGVRNDYVFNIAGFDRRKNLPVLIEAFAVVRAKLGRPVSLVIGGAPHTPNPHVFPDVRPLIAALGLESSVVLPGKVSDEERRHLYGAASVYATPSLYEGFGLTPLEAMACGVPTVVADRTSLPEVVGEAGLVVPPTPAAFAEALLATLTDVSLSTRLAEAGVARARTFSWERTARETAAVYRSIG
jgi:glycosyltransferase involved in cell wall biosynthesis